MDQPLNSLPLETAAAPVEAVAPEQPYIYLYLRKLTESEEGLYRSKLNDDEAAFQVFKEFIDNELEKQGYFFADKALEHAQKWINKNRTHYIKVGVSGGMLNSIKLKKKKIRINSKKNKKKRLKRKNKSKRKKL